MIERAPLPARDYVVLNNSVVRDTSLSFKARGVLAFLLSQPPGYSTSAERIAEASKEGRHAILSALRELEHACYLVRFKRRLANGRFLPVDIVYDSPHRDEPEAGNRLAVPPAETHESPGQTGSGFPEGGEPADKDLVPEPEILKAEVLKPPAALTLAVVLNPDRPADFDTFWDAYPRKTDKGGARKAFAKAAKKEAPEVLTVAALNLARDPNLPEPQYVPHASTWLNGERWTDGPLPPRCGVRVSKNHDAVADTFVKMRQAGMFPQPKEITQ